ncbi:hypothetical protein KDW54_17680 [Burkholderia ambifaria]|uniref:hypothetical protein n=1 Tax=Burkholderia ambifaria TaxID=152480 RepID=UPI001BA344BD|nr:hypothetical protein [Burkholderia ambifaria]MBR8184232.1 hypothetical protein [Burkholderia ambifaria]
MSTENTCPQVFPPVGDKATIARLREFAYSQWPAGLSRFATFALDGDAHDVAWVAVAWQPDTRRLYALRISRTGNPPASRMGKTISVDDGDWVSRVRVPTDRSLPANLEADLAYVPPSMLKGYQRRLMLLHALIMLDPRGRRQPSDYMLNDDIFFDIHMRARRIEQIAQALGRPAHFKGYIRKLFTRFMWYGGRESSMFALTPQQGGPNKKRLSPAMKPGRLTRREMMNRARATMKGKTTFRRGRRIDANDIRNMTEALTKYWAGEKLGLATTYRRMVDEYYQGVPEELIPSYNQIQYNYKDIVQANGLLEKRYGQQVTAQYLLPRPGSSSDLSQGVMELVDADGFRPKIPIGALVKGRLEPVEIVVVLVVSRSSGAILGYEISLEGERPSGYLRALVCALLPKDERVASLGLEPLPGLVYGNIDGMFVDNGAGKSKAVQAAVVNRLGGIMFYAPSGRGDLKGVIERVNNAIIQLVAEETRQGYTRGKSLLERTRREERKRLKPISLDDFERHLLKTISYLNTTSNKSRLRTQAMRNAGVGIAPADIHVYNQGIRRGEAAKIRTPAEIYDIFLPWEQVTVANGRIRYKRAGYTSPALLQIATEYSMLPGKNPRLTVEVKRVGRFSTTLLCRNKGCKVFEIEMVEEDKRRFGMLTWKNLELALLDDSIGETVLAKRRVKQSRTLKATKQEGINAIERGRGNPYAGAVGMTKSKAKQNAAALRESDQGRAERRSYGLDTGISDVKPQPLPKWELEPVLPDDPLAAASLLAEERHRKSS